MVVARQEVHEGTWLQAAFTQMHRVLLKDQEICSQR